MKIIQSFRIRPELYYKLDARAENTGKSKTEILEKALEKYFRKRFILF